MIAAFLAFSVMKLKEHVTKDKEFQEHQKCSEISLEVILLPNRSHLNAIYIYIYMYTGIMICHRCLSTSMRLASPVPDTTMLTRWAFML